MIFCNICSWLWSIKQTCKYLWSILGNIWMSSQTLLLHCFTVFSFTSLAHMQYLVRVKVVQFSTIFNWSLLTIFFVLIFCRYYDLFCPPSPTPIILSLRLVHKSLLQESQVLVFQYKLYWVVVFILTDVPLDRGSQALYQAQPPATPALTNLRRGQSYQIVDILCAFSWVSLLTATIQTSALYCTAPSPGLKSIPRYPTLD